MSAASLPAATRAGGVLFAAALAAFIAMWLMGRFHETLLAVPAAIGWAAAILALRPLVPDDKRTALYFAFGVMAFLMFFLHETYEYSGAVRNFPLIIGWAGVVLSLLDILSLTDTRMGHAVANFFGSTLAEPPGEGRSAGREIACFAALAGGVVLIWLLGFLVASPLFVFLWMWLWGRKSVRHSLYGAAGTLAFVWVLFEQVLRYELYRGILTERLLEAVLL